MRIGLVIYGELSITSGGYLYDRMLVRSLRMAGAQVDIISIPWRDYPRHLTDNLSRRLYERHLPSPREFDVILQDELNHPSLFLLNRRLQRREGNPPLISVVHHLRSDEDHPAPARLLYSAIERTYLRSVDAFIFNSNTTRDRVLSHRNGSAPGVVAFPAADHVAPPPVERVAEAVEARRSSSAPLQVLFVGNVIARKGVQLLLDALAQRTPGDVRLHVAGSLSSDPAYASRIRQSIVRHGLEERVTLHGSVSADELRLLYSESDVLAVPSYEGFGIVYLEAMSYGLPVIATTAGAAHEIVDHGRNGFLIAPGDANAVGKALALLSGDRSLLATMGAAARTRYDSHPTWQETFSEVQRWLWEDFGGNH